MNAFPPIAKCLVAFLRLLIVGMLAVALTGCGGSRPSLDLGRYFRDDPKPQLQTPQLPNAQTPVPRPTFGNGRCTRGAIAAIIRFGSNAENR